MGSLRTADDLLLAAVVAVVAVVAGLAVIGWLRQSVHRPARATGDAELVRLMDELRNPVTRRLALTVVDLWGRKPGTRFAFIGCDQTTRFEIGSVTKGLTGLLMADALARGEVGLSQLAGHTSGRPRLPRWPFLVSGAGSYLFGIDPYARQRPSRLLGAAQRCRTSDIGRRRYSNLGAALAGQAVASAAGLPYDPLLRERIFEPLGMTHTAADPQVAAPRGWRKHGRRSCSWRMGAYAPAGGVVSNSADLGQLVEALLTRTAPGAAALGDPAVGSGLFWLTDTSAGPDRTRVWHNGETGGYTALLVLYPGAGRGIVALADRADHVDVERLVAEVARRLTSSPSVGDHQLGSPPGTGTTIPSPRAARPGDHTT
jgi:CubicO group peptidase (beta-lactamase class C family)